MWSLATLTEFYYKKIHGRFAGTKKVAVITRWPYGGVPLYIQTQMLLSELL